MALVAATRARAGSGAYQLFKADAHRWLVLRDALSRSEDDDDDDDDSDEPGAETERSLSEESTPQIVLLLRTKRSSRYPLTALVDAVDERVCLPLVARGVALAARRLLFSALERRRTLQLCRELGDAAQRELVGLQAAQDALQRRLDRETELHDLATQWLVAADEDAVASGVVAVVRRWLACDDVTLETTTAALPPPPPSSSSGTQSVVDVEHVVRLRIPAPSLSTGTLGTLVVRLTPQQHARLCDREDERSLQPALGRLASLAGLAWTRVRERTLERERQSALAAAVLTMETLQCDVAALQSSHEQATARASELERELARCRGVDTENAALRETIATLQTQALDHAHDRQALVTQVKRMEAQLIEVNCQLETSIRSERQRAALEDAHAQLQTRVQLVERKLLKRKLEAQQRHAELVSRRQQHERDQLEIAELRQQVAVLTERQQQQQQQREQQQERLVAMDPSAVATVAVQAAHAAHAERSASQVQAQALAQAQAQQHSSSNRQRRERDASAGSFGVCSSRSSFSGASSWIWRWSFGSWRRWRCTRCTSASWRSASVRSRGT
ncbi:hypothetical protein PINS_up011080 [Pythium insidiosum]|nr:hypothetical protein PINS_up011080 [Pythium insidiosum]